MRKRHYFSKSAVEELYYLAGLSQQEIADIFGCSHNTISKNMIEWGINPHSLDSEEKEMLVEIIKERISNENGEDYDIQLKIKENKDSLFDVSSENEEIKAVITDSSGSEEEPHSWYENVVETIKELVVF